MVANTCNSTYLDAEEGGSHIQGQLGQLSKTLSQNKKKKGLGM
jgi:hypothetical protein